MGELNKLTKCIHVEKNECMYQSTTHLSWARTYNQTLINSSTHRDDIRPISFNCMLLNDISEQLLVSCSNRSEETKQQRFFTRYVLFLFLELFHSSDYRVKRPIDDYTKKNITISGSRYETIEAICHLGDATMSGHYWCIVKHEEDWLQINDQSFAQHPP